MRAKILSIMGIIMLILFTTIGFFAIPIGITVNSLIGLVCGIKYKDQTLRKWSYGFLIIGILCIVYTLLNIYSM